MDLDLYAVYIVFSRGNRIHPDVLADAHIVGRQPHPQSDLIPPAGRKRLGPETHVLRDKPADRTLSERFERTKQIGIHAKGFRARQRKRKIKEPLVTLRLRKLPTPGHVGHGHLLGLPGRIEGGQEHRQHHQQRGSNRRQRRIVQGQPAQRPMFVQQHHQRLTDQVTERGSKRGKHSGFCQEERGYVAGRQPHC